MAVLGGEATSSEGFVISFLKVPLACLGSMAAAAQQPGELSEHILHCNPRIQILL